MKDILARPQRELLTRFAWSNVLIGLDFDGTLAPIVPRPDDAKLRVKTRSILTRLAAVYPVAILSGRSRADVVARLRDVPVAAVVGNHGLEPGGDLAGCENLVGHWMPSLGSHLLDVQGVEIEDKTYSVAIHYRRSRARRAALARIVDAVGRLGPKARMMGGKLVVNVLPTKSAHKGIALMRLRSQLRTDTALYVGDDVTDEDVFALDDPGRLLCIRVGASTRTQAPYFVRSQSAVDDLLGWLLEIRRQMVGRRGNAMSVPP